MKRCFPAISAAAVVLLTFSSAFAAPGDAAPQDTLLPDKSLILPWVVAAGFMVLTFIAGFLTPGRTHMD